MSLSVCFSIKLWGLLLLLLLFSCTLGLKLTNFLPQPSTCRDYTCLLPYSGHISFHCILPLLFYIIYMSFLCIYVCAILVPDMLRVQKRASNNLELDLQMLVSHKVSRGSQIQVLWKKKKMVLNC